MTPLRLALGAAAAAAAGIGLGIRDAAIRAEADHPPPGRFVNLPGGRLHYLDRGTGRPPVVLLHGMGSMVEDWITSGVVELLAMDHRVVAFDRPGFGHSPRPRGRNWGAAAQAALLVQAFARLGLDRPVVVGHSWGALVAAAIALDHPEAVRGLVLVSGPLFSEPAPQVMGMMPAGLPGIGDALNHSLLPPLGRLLQERGLDHLFGPAPVPAAFRAGFPIAMALRPWQLRASGEEAIALKPEAAALAPRYRDLRLPVAILAGGADRLLDTAAQSGRAHAEIPGSTLTVIAGAGHMVHHAAPEALVARVAEVA